MGIPKTKMKRTINILGLAGVLPPRNSTGIWKIERLLGEVRIKINAISAGGCTVKQLTHAREFELNVSWCLTGGRSWAT